MSISPPTGCSERTNEMGVLIGRLHYSADPAKTSVWADAAKKRAPSDLWWKQEMEIDFGAALGSKLFPEFERKYTVCKPYKLEPKDHTKWMCIDPHPRRPHGMLWLAVDRWDNHVYYRDYWPSRTYGKRGDTPEDDKIFHIDDYCKTIKFLESDKVDVFGPQGFADNGGKDEKIYRRVMDPAGKAFATKIMDGKPSPESMWDRYRQEGIICTEAKKDFQVSRDSVGQRLRPRTISDGDGEHTQSQIIIFDTCQELILELETARFPRLTALQAEKQDPAENPLKKRLHLLDCLRYIEIENPHFIEPSVAESVRPVAEGIAY